MTGSILLGLLLVILAVWAFWPKPPQAPAQAASIAEAEAYLNSLAGFGTPPALSVTVVRNGAVIYDKGFGYADAPQGIPADERTTYHWWSATKIATAVAVLQLQERGLLSLDDPVVDHLPWFQVEYPSAASKTITIRHLLNHSSGMGDLNPIDLFRNVHAYGEPPVNQTEFAQRMFPNYRKLAFEPGMQGTYTNFGYIVLGAVIEQASGSSYEDYIRANILQPLGMTQTDFVYSDSMKDHAALGSHPLLNALSPLVPIVLPNLKTHLRETTNGRFWFNLLYTDYTPSTGLIGPASDAARLLRLFLEDGIVDGARILSPESLALVTQNSVEGVGSGPAMLHPGLRHGLGWWILDCGGRACLEHTGEGMGYGSTIRVYPNENLGIAVFTNDMTSDRETIIDLLATVPWEQP